MAMIHMEPQTLQLFERVLGTLKPPPNLTLSQWADKYRRLSAEASSAKGQWNTDEPHAAGVQKQAHFRVPAASEHAHHVHEIEHLGRHVEGKYQNTEVHVPGHLRRDAVKSDQRPADSHHYRGRGQQRG